MKSTNGGMYWTRNPIYGVETRGFSFSDFNTGTAVGPDGRIIKTINGGTNWFSQDRGVRHSLWGISFTDDFTGSVVGMYGTILRTTNGGITWILQDSGTQNHLEDVHFIDENFGTAVGFNGTILRTANGGITWSQLPIGSGLSFNAIYFLNENVGIALGGYSIYKTTDGGITWSQKLYLYGRALDDIDFADQYNGIVVGGLVTQIIKTTDAGETWNIQYATSNMWLHGVSYFDVNNCIAVGWQGSGGTIILKTTNGGTDWFQQMSGISLEELNDVSFVNENNGTIVGPNGTILNTTDGGYTWIQQSSITTNDLFNVYFTNPQNGFAIGEDGTLISTYLPGVVSVEPENEIEPSPKNYLLSQNYPNPFNPVTKIKYSIPQNVKRETGNVNLKIYDVLGREVATLVNEEKPAGEYEVEFDGSSLTSGIYFYQIKAGEFLQTKKMVLLK
jgi:photosystem II stability/assembly factor-like uncharacterized protein